MQLSCKGLIYLQQTALAPSLCIGSLVFTNTVSHHGAMNTDCVIKIQVLFYVVKHMVHKVLECIL